MDFNIWGRFWPTKMLSIYKFLQFCKALQGSSQTWSAEVISKLLWKDTSERKRFNATMFAGESPESCAANQVTPSSCTQRNTPFPFQGLDWKCHWGISFLGGTGVKSNELKSRSDVVAKGMWQAHNNFNFRTDNGPTKRNPMKRPGVWVGPTLPSAVKRRAINLDVGNYHGLIKELKHPKQLQQKNRELNSFFTASK